MSLNTIDIPKRHRSCCTCSKPFKGAEIYYSALQEGEGTVVFTRKDLCAPCWEKEQVSDQKTYWKGVLPDNSREQELPPKDVEARIFQLFKQNLEEEKIPQAFILALFLQRRRKLVPREELEKAYVYEWLETGAFFTIPKVKVQELPLEQLQVNIAESLKKREQ
jgi:hypothetical protein